MASAIRPIGHEDRLSLVDHLDELRTRLIISGVVLGVAFGVLLLAEPRAAATSSTSRCRQQTAKQVAKGEGTAGQAVLAQQAMLESRGATRSAALEVARRAGERRSPADARAQLRR